MSDVPNIYFTMLFAEKVFTNLIQLLLVAVCVIFLIHGAIKRRKERKRKNERN